MSGIKEFSRLFKQYSASRIDPYKASPSEVYCPLGKDPDVNKIVTYCQKTRCKNLATYQDCEDKGLI